ncbi:unnamed protein product [Bemisia tabaci]|uniref:NAD-dependent epimerase/dehydratase domain-containing protein n=1 Tax=Bemisia tabaci TaxID=7038 RepID=A0A9P0F6Y4_BEMTA|nr:PREDICTED: uncharacterized protein LOC109037121 [Bemisia tabaci]CAH0394943.1 unnamed protein product [Bemisia tabaci]
MGSDKPAFLILGGCGFIGRNFVEFLIDNDVASYIRVVDKLPPQVAWLNKRHSLAFKDPRVEHVSANLMYFDSCEKAFANPPKAFDYILNCACETRLGQSEAVYEEGIVRVSLNCAKLAAKIGAARFVELSSGCMASSEQTAHKESDPCKPWTDVAVYKLKVEEKLKSIEGLRYTIIRPGIVYGFGDKTGLTPRLVIGAVYQHLGESMRLLWDKDLRMNTIHVKDLCEAIWFLMKLKEAHGEVYNAVDDGNTTQGRVTDLIASIFNISYDFCGKVMSTLTTVDKFNLMEEINDKHLAPWAEACAASGVTNTPLSSYIHKELLYNKHLHLSNSKLTAAGFKCSVPEINKQVLIEVVNDYIGMNLFPRSVMS